MDIPAHLLPRWFLWLTDGLALALMLLVLRRAPLGRLRDDRFSNVFFAACVFMLLLWNIKAGLKPTLHLHLLGVATLTLMVGWRLALLGVALVLAGTTINGNGGWESFGLNLLLMGCYPALLTHLLLVLAQRKLPHNFFIYIYINAFLAGGLGMVGVGLLSTLIFSAFGIHTTAWLGEQYLVYFPLLFFSESVFNGMLMTMLVALRPEWVCTFDDRLYIQGK